MSLNHYKVNSHIVLIFCCIICQPYNLQLSLKKEWIYSSTFTTENAKAR